jgi:ring-1,2-phenylacetyl-CoA epoxidase subunit PaaD
VLATVPDPEIPVISVVDLGIVRDVQVEAEGHGLHVVLTPTYSGCPATEVIYRDVQAALEAAGLGPVRLTIQRAPAWTTDWLSVEGREKLRAYGIAPPDPVGRAAVPANTATRTGPSAPPGPCPVQQILAGLPDSVPCPRCGSLHTERLAQFGSTPCKALYRCLDCREPFDYFKPI